MIGNPKYKVDDNVKFKLTYENKEYELRGYVYIVDKYGTFEQNKEVSYDIMVENPPFMNEACLFKHIDEPFVDKDE